MMSGHGGGAEVLRIIVFGPVAALASYLAFRPPDVVQRLLATHVAVGVVATILCAALVAFGCRQVVQALLRLVGFR